MKSRIGSLYPRVRNDSLAIIFEKTHKQPPVTAGDFRNVDSGTENSATNRAKVVGAANVRLCDTSAVALPISEKCHLTRYLFYVSQTGLTRVNVTSRRDRYPVRRNWSGLVRCTHRRGGRES